MKIKFKSGIYLAVYILFLYLYVLNFKEYLSYENIKICLYSSILPALVGGTVGNLLLNKKIN